jgi:hypothetical protein
MAETFLNANLGAIHLKVEGQNQELYVSKTDAIPQANFIVHNVTMVNATFTDETLAIVKDLKFIEQFTLHQGHQVTEAGIAQIQSLTSLKHITVYDAQITDIGLAAFAKLPRLESLHVSGGDFTGKGLTSLSALPKLSSIAVSSNALTDEGIMAAAKAPKLDRLSISGPNIRGDGLAALRSSPALRDLELVTPNIDESKMAALSGAVSLRNITLKGNFADATLTHLARIPNLRYLHWEGVEFGVSGMRALSNARSLEQITLRDMTDDLMKAVALLGQVRNINVMGGSQLTDKGLAPMATMASLNHVTVQNVSPQITDDGLAHLAKIPGLQHVNISGATSITDAGLQHFRGKQQLRRLWLSRSQVTDAGVAAFRQVMPNCQVSK